MRNKQVITTLYLALFLICLTAGFSHAASPELVPHDTISGSLDGIILIIIGLFVGILGTFIGAGGGFLVVPLLLIFYNFSPQHAIGTSMAVVFLNTLSGTFSYIAQKKIDYELAVKFSVFAAPGVIIGALLAQDFSMVLFSLLFTSLLLIMAYSLLFVRDFYLVCETKAVPEERNVRDSTGELHTYSPDLSIGFSGSFLIGIVSGLFGIGGGLMHVPLMNFMGIPMHIATATSHLMIAIASFFGVLAFTGFGSIDISFAVFIGVGTILGAYYGAKIAAVTNADVIKKIIAVILILVALKLIIGVI